MTLNASQILEAREWIADCFPETVEHDLSDMEVERGIARHYDGGLRSFVMGF